jgi:hypothetical protein
VRAPSYEVSSCALTGRIGQDGPSRIYWTIVSIGLNGLSPGAKRSGVSALFDAGLYRNGHLARDATLPRSSADGRIHLVCGLHVIEL